MSASSTRPQTLELDVLIVGGGIAGLWVANLLSQAGYRLALLEADRLGGGQTLASQGMVHGGLKYALRGRLSTASEAIAAMPDRWRACLQGRGEIDLRGLTPLAERYYLFAAAGTLGRLTGFFASRALHGRVDRLDPPDWPAPLRDAGFGGVVYGLPDFVLDTDALVRHLAAPVADRLYQWTLDPGACELDAQGVRVTLNNGRCVAARRLIVTAGAGAGPLLEGLGRGQPAMQRRPLHQILVRAPDLPPLFAHCLTGIRQPEPRLTITSHRDQDGQWLWYLGGALATSGNRRSEGEQEAHAREELATCLPWRNWDAATLQSLRIDRAEPAQAGGRRPDEAFVHRDGALIVAWPTKLSLTPDLGGKVCAALADLVPGPGPAPALDLPAAVPGRAPWLSA